MSNQFSFFLLLTACNESYSTANDLISCEVGCRAGVQNDEQRQAEV